MTYPIAPHKRRFPRYQFEAEIIIGLLRGAAPAYAGGRAIDLAEGGAGVRTSGLLDLGEIVDLQIPLPLGPLRLPACVRYQRGSEYGFEFVALNSSNQQAGVLSLVNTNNTALQTLGGKTAADI